MSQEHHKDAQNTPPLHERVAHALDAAGDATGAQLLAHLRTKHSDDPELVRELESLLGETTAHVPVLDETLTIGADASATLLRSALAKAVHGAASGSHKTSPAQAPEPLPQTIGDYRVLRELGRGGMGIVYECEQSEPKRSVAVKVLRRGVHWDASSQDTGIDPRREARVLARLTHAGIVRVIEAGVDADSGQTYFVMDLVRGATLLRYADESDLSIRQRVELLARVCDAVEHAHRKGIIHRDLKPSNVLVESAGGAMTSDEFGTVGQPRVLDFGVAKLTDPMGEGALAKSLLLPGASAIVGTLGYISPEALSGDSHGIDTRADVYALGVILYELLTGKLPVSLTGVPLSEVARRVSEATIVPLRKHDRRLRGDLESIVEKAMEKTPERRYGSAGELSDDLRRFLRNEPVVAQPASAMYLARKFVTRHRAVSALALGLVLALATGLVITLVMITRVEKARKQEQTQRDIANAIRSYLVQDLIGAANPSVMGKDVKLTDALQKIANEVGTRFPGQPELEGRVRHELATVFNSLGYYDEAQQQSEVSLRLLESTVPKDDTACIASLLAQASAFQNKGMSERAEPLAREGLARATRALAENDPFRFRLQAVLSGALHSMGKPNEAIAIMKPVIEKIDSLSGLDFDDRCSFLIQYAAALQQSNPPKLEEAAKQCAAVIEMCKREKQPEHPTSIAARNNLVAVLSSLRRYDEALEYAKELPELARKTFPADHPAHGITALSVSKLYMNTGRLQEAYDWAVKAVDAMTVALGDSTWQTERTISFAAKAARDLKDGALVETWSLRAVVARLRTATASEAQTTVKVFEEYAPIVGKSREELLEYVFSRRDELVPTNHPRHARFFANLAWAAVSMNRPQIAETALSSVGDAGLDEEDTKVRDAARQSLQGAVKSTGN